MLQNIANHVEFSKESHMLEFNEFVKTNFEAGRRFFKQIASDSEVADQGRLDDEKRLFIGKDEVAVIYFR